MGSQKAFIGRVWLSSLIVLIAAVAAADGTTAATNADFAKVEATKGRLGSLEWRDGRSVGIQASSASAKGHDMTATRSGDVELPAGTILTLRLQRGVTLASR